MTGNDVRRPVSLQEQVLEIGTRLKNPPSDRMVESAFTAELSHQVQLFEAIGLVDIAHTLVAIELGTIPKSQGHLLLEQLLALQTKPPSFVMTPALELNIDTVVNGNGSLVIPSNTRPFNVFVFCAINTC